MNIENLRILTGTPGDVEKKVEDYFAENTNARILGTALSVHQAPKVDAKPEKKAAKKKAKAAEDDKDPEDETDAAEGITLHGVEMEDVITVSVTVARAWD